MRINTQFPVAVHILAVLAYFGDGNAPSELIAKSVGTNPVVVRRIMALLKKGGLVDTRPGVKGAALRKDAGDITLLEVYDAVRGEGAAVFDIHPHPFPGCPVGAHIGEAVGESLDKAQRALEKELDEVTLREVVNAIRRRCRKAGK